MTPMLNRGLPPNFSEVGDVDFQELCVALLAEDQIYLNPQVYGRNGQSQRGIDIEATLRDRSGLHVGQCKAWEEPSAKKIQDATSEFLPHLEYWKKYGLKKYILLIGCAVNDTKSQDQLRDEVERFKQIGVEYEYWDAGILRRKLRPYPHIVRNFCEPNDYWVGVICESGSSSLDASAQAGLNSVIARQGTLILELSESRNKELAAVLDMWEEGAIRDALDRVRLFSKTSSWADLTPEVRARSLRIQAGLVLVASGDTADARRLLEQARALMPNSCMALSASIVRCESGVSAALEIVKTPENSDAWKVRFGLLLESGKPEIVLSELNQMPTEPKKSPDIAWIEAMALLCLRRTDEARQVLTEALSICPRSLKLQIAKAMAQYAAGISPAFFCWAHFTWPVPPPWHLVKHDVSSSTDRAEAAVQFEQLAARVEGDEQRELLVWRLACLANEPVKQDEAVALCASLLKDCPSYVPALMWARERNFEFNADASISALKLRMSTHSVNAGEAIALFALLADNESITAAEKILDDNRAVFEREHRLFAWRAHKAQCLISRGERDAALRLADEEIDPLFKRQVRQAAISAIARKEGKPELVGAEFENEYSETGNGDALFSLCLSRRAVKDWAFIADNGERLIALLGTDSALRVAAEGAVNARRADLVLKLLTDNVALCPGRVLPPDLERMRAEAFRQSGQIGAAVEAAEKAARDLPDLDTLMQLFRLKRMKGDLIGSAETAKEFAKIKNVPLSFVTEEVAPTIRHTAPGLVQELVIKARQAIQEDSPALLLIAQQASKVGLADIKNEVFRKLPLWVQKGEQGVYAIDTKQAGEILRSRAQSLGEALESYRRGMIPVHMLCAHFAIALAEWYLGNPPASIADGFPIRCCPLLTRHGSLASEKPVHLDYNQELFLDITSILILHRLGLLETVEAAFPKLVIPARMTVWLHADADRLQPQDPALLAAQELALKLVDDRKIQMWSPTQEFPDSTGEWQARMGRVWCERMARVKANGGVFVDFLPLASNQAEMEPVELPDIEAAYLFCEDDIVGSLEAGGHISPALATDARESLGLLHRDVFYQPRPVNLRPEMEVHLETGIADRLAIAGVLQPLAQAAQVFVDQKQVFQWREASKTWKANTALLSELEKLLAHVSQRFDAKHYRAHECSNLYVPPDHQGPIPAPEICIQDTFDYGENGEGVLCCDDRFLRGLRRGPGKQCVDVFDVVHHLRRTGRLNDDQFYDAFITLRAANLRYLPITKEEILYHLSKAQVTDGEIVETRALRMLRRYVAAMLLDAHWLQRPQQAPDGQVLTLEGELPARLYMSFAKTMVEIWHDKNSSHEGSVAQSDWLWNSLCFDMRLIQELFAMPVGGMSSVEAVGHSLGHLFAQAIAIPGGDRDGNRAAYFQWLFDHCVIPVVVNNAEILPTIGKVLLRMIEENSREMDIAEKINGSDSEDYLSRLFLMGQFLFDLPPAILESIQLSSAEIGRYRMVQTNAPFDVLGVGLDASELWPAVARTLKSGRAAILKPGTRLQFRRTDKSRVFVTRKGEGASPGGNLTVPCLLLLDGQRDQRIGALQLCSGWFDLDFPERQKMFEQLADISEPAERMHQLHKRLEGSAAWFYRRFDERCRDKLTREQPFSISDLLPERLDVLRQHLRLGPKPGETEERLWPSAVATLIESEGLEEAVVRLSTLPARLPEPLVEALCALSKKELSVLLTRLSKRLQSPLQRLQYLQIALRFGEDKERLITVARTDLHLLFDPEKGIHAINALVVILKWVHIRLSWSSDARSWSPETRLRVAWLHAGRLQSIFAACGFPQADLTKWISVNISEISAVTICPRVQLKWDAASPSAITGQTLLWFAIADFAAQLPPETVEQLDLSTLFSKFAPGEKGLLTVLYSICHDPTLRSNILSSYLGHFDRTGLRCFMDETTIASLKSMVDYEGILAKLQSDPHNITLWAALYMVTNHAPLRHQGAEALDRVIQNMRLSEGLKRDAREAHQLILMVCDLGTRDRPAAAVNAIFNQLLEVARAARVRFSDSVVLGGSDNDATSIGFALLEATWECSVVQNDVPASFKRLTENLSLVVSNWPPLARISHSALTNIMQRMPFEYQQGYWRAVLTCRAWW